MLRKSFRLSCLFFFLSIACFAQTKLLTFSPQFTSSVAGTPRVAWDGAREVWVVSWRQGNFIKARTVSENFTISAPKNLASGVIATENSFDVGIDTHDDPSHLLAFENSAGLQVRAIPGLVPGATRLIEAGAKASMPRFVFDAAASRYLLFWLGSQDGTRSALRVRVLNEAGEPQGSTVTLASALSGQTFASLNVARRSNGGMTAIVFQQSNSGGSLLKVNVSASGARQGGTQTFQGATAGLNTIGDIDFSQGIGLGVWIDKAAAKRRKVTAAGGFGGGIALIPNASSPDAKAIQAGVSFNSAAKQFVSVWTNVNKIMGVNLNGTSTAPVKAPEVIASSQLSFARNANVTAGDGAESLVVWEDSSAEVGATGPVRFRIRGAVFTSGSNGGGGTASVSMGDNFYSPQVLTISVNTTVTWTNNGNMTHTVTQGNPGDPEGSGLFDSHDRTPGSTFSFKFTQTGTFPYFCEIHGSIMRGTVVVQ